MIGFGALMASAEANGDGLELDLPEHWAQGRTAYGGLSAALCIEAARRAQPDLPPLRSAQFAFAGPASGRLRARAALLRRGRSASIMSAELDGEAGSAVRALLTYGAARPSRIAHAGLPAPAVPPPDDCAPFIPPGMQQAAPRFMANFAMRLAAGARPLTGAADPEAALWLRHHEAKGAHAETALVALADAPSPAAMIQFPEPGPISTMTWTIDLVGAADPGAWALARSRSEFARDGYSAQAMALWDEAGALLAVGRQTVALFV